MGRNDQGQLGREIAAPQSVDQLEAVPGLQGPFTKITAGFQHTCALTDETTPTVQCWGANITGDGPHSGTPQTVSFIGTPNFGQDYRVVDLIAAGRHTCALVEDNKAQPGDPVWCWGSSSNRAHGTGWFGDVEFVQRTPSQVLNQLGGEVRIGRLWSGAGASCGTIGDDLLCWGLNSLLTDNNNGINAASFIGLQGVRDVAIGEKQICAVSGPGGVRCWGAQEDDQMLFGDGLAQDSSYPFAVPSIVQTIEGPLTGVTKIEVSSSEDTIMDGLLFCATKDAGEIWCWGESEYGLVPDVSELIYAEQVQAGVSDSNALAISTGKICSLGEDDRMSCWGTDDYSNSLIINPMNLNDGLAYPVPLEMLPVQGLARAGDVVVRNNSVFGIQRDDDGSLLWGWTVGELNATELELEGLSESEYSLAVAGDDALCVTLDNGVHCYGTLARGGRNGATVAYGEEGGRVPNLDTMTSPNIACGQGHCCAWDPMQQGQPTTRCWGRNDRGQCGTNNSTTPVNQPQNIEIAGSSRIVSMALGFNHTCASVEMTGIEQTERVYCWGDNSDGKLGLGRADPGSTHTPTLVLDAITNNPMQRVEQAIVAGPEHTCGNLGGNDGITQGYLVGLACWGKNNGGAIGQNPNMSSSNLARDSRFVVIESAPDQNARTPRLGGRTLAANSQTTCFISHDMNVRCFGTNRSRLIDPNQAESWSADYDQAPHPVPVVSGRELGALTMSDTLACASLQGETGVLCWGDGLATGRQIQVYPSE
jgi:alpha-tubulin suppressor-like RCC1 family protein